jgi:hypothetical protein
VSGFGAFEMTLRDICVAVIPRHPPVVSGRSTPTTVGPLRRQALRDHHVVWSRAVDHPVGLRR